MEKARVLKLEETLQHGKVVWLELRETAGVIPVAFWAERMPFLKYDAQDRVAMIEVRAEYYRKTWRCWDQRPDGLPVPDWQDPEETGKAAKETRERAGVKTAERIAAAGRKPAGRKKSGGAAK